MSVRIVQTTDMGDGTMAVKGYIEGGGYVTVQCGRDRIENGDVYLMLEAAARNAVVKRDGIAAHDRANGGE